MMCRSCALKHSHAAFPHTPTLSFCTTNNTAAFPPMAQNLPVLRKSPSSLTLCGVSGQIPIFLHGHIIRLNTYRGIKSLSHYSLLL